MITLKHCKPCLWLGLHSDMVLLAREREVARNEPIILGTHPDNG